MINCAKACCCGSDRAPPHSCLSGTSVLTFGSRAFAGAIKLRRTHIGFSWALNLMTDTVTRRAHTETVKVMWRQRQRSEWGNYKPRSHYEPGTGKEGFHRSLQKDCHSADSLTSAFWPLVFERTCEVCPGGIQPCNRKSKVIYWRRYKKHCS